MYIHVRLTDGVGTPDLNPRHLVNVCVSNLSWIILSF